MLFWLLAGVILGAQTLLGVKVDYPPSEDQIRFLGTFGVGGELSLWILRIVLLVILLIVLERWRRLIGNRFSISVASFSVLLVMMSPTFWALWYLHPFDCLKVIGVILAVTLIAKTKHLNGVAGIVLLVSVIVFNRVNQPEKAAIWYRFDLRQNQEEITQRIYKEDSLAYRVNLPLLFRRLGYNKYFWQYKKMADEVIPFWDLETVFFQEMHPKMQKSLVIFFWPTAVAFIFGVFTWARKRRSDGGLLLLLLLLALVNFVFSAGVIYQRFELVLLPVSLMAGLGLNRLKLLAEKNYWWAKTVYVSMLILVSYGVVANLNDLGTRPDFWLDNRPLIYRDFYTHISHVRVDNFPVVQVTGLIGDARGYCYFYLGTKCDSEKFIFRSFNLAGRDGVEGGLYAGFLGEFVGPDQSNNFSPGWKNDLLKGGYKILFTKDMRDTVAYRYSNNIILAVKNEKEN